MEDLIRIGSSPIIATIPVGESASIIVTNTHALVKHIHWTYIVDSTCPTYTNFLSLAEWYKKEDISKEGDEMRESLKYVYVTFLGMHTFLMQDPVFAKEIYAKFNEYMIGLVEESAQADLEDDTPEDLLNMQDEMMIAETIEAIEGLRKELEGNETEGKVHTEEEEESEQ